MSLLSYFFKTDLFKAFDEKLKRFQAIDEELTKITGEIEEKARVDSGTFFHQKRVFDLNKIDKRKMNELLVLFKSMESMEYTLLSDFQKNKTKFLEQSKEITEYLEKEFSTIFQHVKDAKTFLNEIIEYLQEFKAEELENDFDKLSSKFQELRVLILNIKIKIEKEKQPANKKFIEVLNQEYAQLFVDKCKKYHSVLKQIKETMSKIKDAPEYNEKYHEPIVRGRYAGFWHARIRDNVRLFYKYDYTKKTILWYDIITKNDFDKA